MKIPRGKLALHGGFSLPWQRLMTGSGSPLPYLAGLACALCLSATVMQHFNIPICNQMRLGAFICNSIYQNPQRKAGCPKVHYYDCHDTIKMLFKKRRWI
jgi:hypothetical protein